MYNLYSNETEPDDETQQPLDEASHCQTETQQGFGDEQSTSSQDPPSPLSEGPPPAKQPRVRHTDLGTFLPSVSSGRTAVTDHDKFCLIEEHFVPEPSYKFPPGSNRRAFQYRWLTRYQWLRYSEHDNGGYCLPCALFYTPSNNLRSDPGVLVMKPLTNFQKALEILGKHETKEFHKFSVVKMIEFTKVMTNQQPSIQSQLSQAKADIIASNCLKLASIVETILLCGRQNIPLRGHRDSLNDFEHDPSAQHGNFWALLQFRVAAGDTVLKEHLLSGSVVKRNATYTSYRIQNEILDILGNIITQKIVTKIKMASYYTIIADEVTDCSNKEQLAIVLRYVNAGDNVIHENFLAFIVGFPMKK